jgi:hypothetical protein
VKYRNNLIARAHYIFNVYHRINYYLLYCANNSFDFSVLSGLQVKRNNNNSSHLPFSRFCALFLKNVLIVFWNYKKVLIFLVQPKLYSSTPSFEPEKTEDFKYIFTSYQFAKLRSYCFYEMDKVSHASADFVWVGNLQYWLTARTQCIPDYSYGKVLHGYEIAIFHPPPPPPHSHLTAHTKSVLSLYWVYS